MLPSLPVSLLAPTCVAACAQPVLQGDQLRAMLSRSGLDSSAAGLLVTEARARASVHVAYLFVPSPDGDRGEPRGSGENHLRRRHLSRVFAASTQITAVTANSTGRFASTSDPTIAHCEAHHRPCAAFHFHSASRQRSTLRPPARQGGPPSQERIREYEERNVGQCLAARGVPHRHR